MYILIIVVPFSKSTVVVVLGLTGFELWGTIAAMHSKLTSNSRIYVGWGGTSRDALSSHFPGCSQAIHQTHCPQVCNPNSQLPSPWPRWKRLPGNHAARKQPVCRHFYFLHFSPEESSAIQEWSHLVLSRNVPRRHILCLLLSQSNERMKMKGNRNLREKATYYCKKSVSLNRMTRIRQR